MYELRTITGTLRAADGAVRAGANVRVVRETAVADGDAFPPSAVAFYTDANGNVPNGTAVAVPSSGAWAFALLVDSVSVCSFAMGAGAPITVAEILALAGLEAEGGTPQQEMLLALYTAVSGADDYRLLETASGGIQTTNQPRGYWMQPVAVEAGKSVVIPAGHQMVVVGDVDVAGDLIVEGSLITGDDVDNYDPAGTAAAVQAILQDSLDAHTDDFVNPHQVTAAQVGAAALRPSVSEQSGPYTFATSDEGCIVASLGADPITFTIDSDANTPFPVGAIIGLEQQGAGSLTIAGAVGVTVNSLDGSLTLAGQWACAALRKIADNTWILAGALA